MHGRRVREAARHRAARPSRDNPVVWDGARGAGSWDGRVDLGDHAIAEIQSKGRSRGYRLALPRPDDLVTHLRWARVRKHIPTRRRLPGGEDGAALALSAA